MKKKEEKKSSKNIKNKRKYKWNCCYWFLEEEREKKRECERNHYKNVYKENEKRKNMVESTIDN